MIWIGLTNATKDSSTRDTRHNHDLRNNKLKLKWKII